MSKPKRGLTDKEKRFVDEYMIDQSGAKAAVRAGYSERNGARIAWQLLRRPVIIEAIEARQAKLAAKLGVTTERILEELAKIGFSDIRKAVTWGEYSVQAVPSADVDDDTAAAIAEVSSSDKGIKVKLHDKRAALIDLGKHLGMFKDKLELTGKDGGPIETAQYDDKTKARAMALILAKGLKPKSNA